MARTITKAAPHAPIKELAEWFDRETSKLFRHELSALGVGQEQAAQLLGISRMQLYRTRNESARADSLGRKIWIYTRLAAWAAETLTEEDRRRNGGLDRTWKPPFEVTRDQVKFGMFGE